MDKSTVSAIGTAMLLLGFSLVFGAGFAMLTGLLHNDMVAIYPLLAGVAAGVGGGALLMYGESMD